MSRTTASGYATDSMAICLADMLKKHNVDRTKSINILRACKVDSVEVIEIEDEAF